MTIHLCLKNEINLPQVHAKGCQCSWQAGWGSRQSSCSPSPEVPNSSPGCSSLTPGKVELVKDDLVGEPSREQGRQEPRWAWQLQSWTIHPLPRNLSPEQMEIKDQCIKNIILWTSFFTSFTRQWLLTCWYVSGRRWRKTSPSKPPTGEIGFEFQLLTAAMQRFNKETNTRQNTCKG